MHLSNIGLVHWHLFPLLDIPVEGPVVGISGENKSGKSTILDAIQTVMTGADQKAMNLNRAASEAGRGAHRRTVHAYCLGRLSSDKVLREASSTTIVLAFRDPVGIAPPISIGVALEADLADNSVHVVSRFIVHGVELRARDVVRSSDGILEVEPWSECRPRLEATVRAQSGTLTEYRDTAREFVREYMFALFQKGRSALPTQFVRSFINAIAFKEMDSANEFVRTYLLEDEPIQVQALRRSIQVYREADKAVKELNQQLTMLKRLREQLGDLADLMEQVDRETWIMLRARAAAAVTHSNSVKRRLAKTLLAIAHEEAELERTSNEIERIRIEMQAVQIERAAALSEEKQATLKREIEIFDRDLEDLRRPISARDGAAAVIRNLLALRALVDIASADGGIFALLDEAEGLLPSALSAEFPRKPERLDEIVAMLNASMPGLAEVVEKLRQSTGAEEARLRDRRAELAATITAAREGRVLLAGNVEAMLGRLQKEGMRPRVLAQMVEIADERWAEAAEGFLGIDREAIFVDPQHCHAATEILSKDRRLYHRVRIANTRKLASMQRRAEAGTLATVFRTGDPLAEAFLIYRTGGVQLARNRSDFDRQGRWILDDGTYDDGVMIDVKEPQGGLKLGAKGIEANAANAARELAELEQKLALRQGDLRVCERWARAIEAFVALAAPTDAEPLSFTAVAAGVARKQLEIETRRGAISALASADVSQFDQELTLMQSNLDEAAAEQKSRAARLNDLHGKRGDDAGKHDAGEGQPGSRRHAQMEWWRYRQGIRKVAVREPVVAYVARRSVFKSVSALAEDAERQVNAAREDARDLQTECELGARECLNALRQGDLFGLRPSLFNEIRPWVDEQVEEIESGTLVEYEAELSDARRKTNDIFRNSFAHELAARFSKVEAELRDVREVLRKYVFLDERYSFRSQRAPGYEAFHTIVARLHEVELSDVPLFKGDIGDDHPLATELRIVEAVLLADDVDISIYEDYRRYFTFELDITSISSGRTVSWSERKGTASGGETQTPYYVALLSALSSIYYGGARSRSEGSPIGLCLAAFDEAFSKLDETVRYEMVSYCKDLGLQLLICGPDGGRQSMERYAHTIVDVWRRGDESYARADIIKQRTRDELKAIDPSRLTREELVSRMTAAAE